MHLIARKGNGKIHAKWSPVATCIMRAIPDVKLEQEKINKLSKEDKKELVEVCPRKVFKYDENMNTLDIEDALKCNICNECVKLVEKEMGQERAIKISESESTYEYTVETTGSLAPEQVVSTALSVLREKIMRVRDNF